MSPDPQAAAADPALLRALPGVAVRRIALAYLDAAAAAYPRLGTGLDDDALHDFRVALRRLRSTLRSYATQTGDTVSPKLRRRLTKVARLTGPSRDLEVQLEWLARARPSLDLPDEAGHALIVDRLARARKRADRRMLRRLGTRWARLHDGLDDALSRYTAPLPGRGETPTPFAGVVARAARRLTEGLVTRLAAIDDPADETPAHDARIAGKRLRYLLEPIAGELATGELAVRELKALQEALGDLHDAHVLEQLLETEREVADADDGRRGDDPSLGVATLLRLARSARDESFERARQWLGDGALRVAGALDAVRGELASIAGSGVEVERKYLLSACPEIAAAAPSRAVVQGYLPGAVLIERLRRTQDADGKVRHTRTVKSGTGVTRLEVEEECDAALFEALWPATEGRRVEKRRHVVQDGGQTWEVDVFTDRDLVLAEVEVSDALSSVVIPDWLATVMVREVTDEPEFLNAVLAR